SDAGTTSKHGSKRPSSAAGGPRAGGGGRAKVEGRGMDPADDARLTGKYAKRPAVGKPAARKPAAGKLTERPETVTRSQPATGDKGRSPRNFSGQRALTRPSAPASKS